MSVYVRIYAAAADGAIQSPSFSTVYATARTSTPAFSSSATSSGVGQTFSTPNYGCYQYVSVFDTSSVSSSSTAATVSFRVGVGATGGGDVIEFRAVSGLTNAVSGDDLASKTPLYGTWTMAITTGRKTVPLDITSLPRGSGAQIIFSSQNQRTATAPTGASQYVSVDTAEASGTTNDPYLDISGGWSIVGVGALPTPGTTLTLVEPAGVAAGDLLVACIASRSTATTAPTITGWTAVGSQNNNNTLTTGSAIASGAMLYVVRGASAPTLAVTIPSGVSVVMGQIVAYRGNATTTPLDVSTAATAAAGLAPSVTGLTTTQDDDLIVAMAAGGQEAAWSAFTNATTPLTASAATDTTAVPSISAWIERADNVTTTGADTSLGIFDAVRTTTGATGNLTVTASVSAGHVVIAGAFKIYVPPTADAWSNADKSATVTLSNSDKKATATSSAIAGIRSTTRIVNSGAGKYYAELKYDNLAGTYGFGIQPTSSVITNDGVAALLWEDGSIQTSGSGGNLGTASATNDVACLAWDIGADLIWFRKNGGNWNGSATANPATGVEGIDPSVTASATCALWGFSQATGNAGTIRTELAEFTQGIPSGFTSWMGETPASGGVTVNATGVSAGSAVGTATVDTVASASFEAVGVAAGSAVGTATVTAVVRADVTVDAVGVAAATAIGTAAVTAKSNVSTLATGQSATAAAGEVSATAKTNISTLATGQAAVSVAGTATVTARANVSTAAVGVSAAAAVGTPGVSSSGAVSVSATSVAALAAVGEVSIVGVANVTTTGVAASAIVGSPSVGGTANVTATGVSAAAQTGIVSVSTTQIVAVTPTGQATAALIGGISVAVGGGISVTPTSAAAAALTGTATVSAIQVVTVEPLGQTATALTGNLSIIGTATVGATGHAATVLMGAASVATKRTATIDATGVAATALAGSTSVATGGSVSLTGTGVSAGALAGTVTATALQAATIAPIGQAVTVLAGNVLVSSGVSVLADGQAVTAQGGSVIITTTGVIGGMNVWTGTGWADKPANVWTGSVWVPKPVKIWNGSVWV